MKMLNAIAVALVLSTSVMASDSGSHSTPTPTPAQPLPVPASPSEDLQVKLQRALNACLLQQGVQSDSIARSIGADTYSR